MTTFPFGGGNVTYTYTVTNPGSVALNNVTVTDDRCSPVSRISGDLNANNLLDLSERWIYTCLANIPVTTLNIATAKGTAGGFTATSYAFAIVRVAVPSLPNTGFAPGVSSGNFTRNLLEGSQGDDVKALQQFLNSHGSQVSTSGLGSPGNETNFFGQGTKTALVKWQIANNILPATGDFGPKSRSTIAKEGGESFSATALLATQVLATKNVVSTNQVRSGRPVRLLVPKLKVDTIIQGIGLTAGGAIDVPKGPKEVAWFNLGPRPGEIGSAVISGHYGWKDGIPAVFDNLKKLQPGDKILVKDEKGVTTTFVVREIRVFGEKEEAPTVFNSNDGKAHLNLVTCGGIWDKVQKSYSQRTVVFTDKVNSSGII